MTAADLQADLAALDRTLQSIEAVLDPAAKKAEIAELAEQAGAPDLWDDQENAQAVTSKLSRLQAEVDRIAALRGRVDDLGVLIELAVEEDERRLTIASISSMVNISGGRSKPLRST